MAKLVYALNQSLDGYVDHQRFVPRPALFRHFIERVRGLAGMVYGRRMYETMRYWDDDHAAWDAEERDYAAVCRSRVVEYEADDVLAAAAAKAEQDPRVDRVIVCTPDKDLAQCVRGTVSFSWTADCNWRGMRPG